MLDDGGVLTELDEAAEELSELEEDEVAALNG